MNDKTSIIGGSELSYSLDLETPAWVVLNGLEEVPEFRTSKGERKTTTINDTVHQFEDEMDTPQEQDITCQYHKADADQLAFRAAARNKTPVLIKCVYADGDELQVPVKLKNYGIPSGAPESTKYFVCTLRRTDDITHDEAAS
ncbi:hypothetical protein [Neptunicella sp.]|uniref:hypothetical protein n=1 Tax=Neptunicella sp. TaxID=2125986 RepID=UPI003F693C3E